MQQKIKGQDYLNIATRIVKDAVINENDDLPINRRITMTQTPNTDHSAPGKLMVLVGSETSAGTFLQLVNRDYAKDYGKRVVVCVEPGLGSGHALRKQFNENMTLALLSGAMVIHLLDADIVGGLTNLLTEHNIKRIVIGNFKPAKLTFSRYAGYLIRQLRRRNPEVEITRIKMKNESPIIKTGKITMKTRPKEYLIAIGAVAVVSVISFLLKDLIGYQTVGLIFLILIAILSLFLGRGAVILTAVLNFGIWNYFFIPPILTFHIDSIHDIIVLFANLAVAITGGSLISRLRKNQADLELSRKNITLLYSLLESLNNANSIKDVVAKVRSELDRHFNADAVVYLKEKNGSSLEKRPFGNTDFFNDDEFEYACRVFGLKERQVVRRLNSGENIQYFPLTAQGGPIGVIGIGTKAGMGIDDDKLIFLKSYVTQITSALEREISIDKAKDIQVSHESQKLFQTVLNSVSHELRTPVSVISSAVSNLLDERTAANPENRRTICNDLETSAQRLNQLIENILDMSKIDSGYLSLDCQPCDVNDLVGVALNQMKEELSGHRIEVSVPDTLPAVSIDMNWMKQAIMNILRNAVSYTPVESTIAISATDNNDLVELAIADNGPGVPSSSLLHLFDKFYRVPGSKSGGTGLGLTIAKALTEAHKGTITARNKPGGGLLITLQLPTAN